MNIDHIKALTSMVYGLNVVTTKSGDKVNGSTVACAIGITWTPPSIAIAIYEKGYTHKLLSESQYFYLHILSTEQEELATKFGSKSGRDIDKFSGVNWRTGIEGVPLIEGCKAVMFCKKVNQLRVGDTTLFVGEIIDSHSDESKKELVMDKSVFMDPKYMA